jgi:hypothetical protein
VPRNTSGLKRGGPGRKKGAKDSVPRTFKASIKAVFEELLTSDPAIIREAVRRGLTCRKPKDAFPYVRIYAELSGELKQQVELSGTLDVTSARDALAGRIAGLVARLGTGDVVNKPQ